MTRRRTVITLLLALCTVCAVPDADAQLFKKVFGKKSSRKHKVVTEGEHVAVPKESKRSRRKHRKEERRLEKETKKGRRSKSRKEKKNTAEKKSTAKRTRSYLEAPVKRREVKYAATQKKDRYRIDLLAPLYLDELVGENGVAFKGTMPEKAVPGVAFYQGAKLAADSLERAGHSIDLVIHDIATFSESPDMLITNRRLDSADLIIGAVQSTEVPALATYARKKKVNFISALSPASATVKDNPYVTLVQPVLKTHCEWISSDVTKKFPQQRVVLLYRTSVQADDNARKYFTNEIEGEADLRDLECNSLPTKDILTTVFDTAKPNVVIIPILDINYADSLLKSLTRYFPGTHFTVYGMPTWNNLTNLTQPLAYSNLTVNVTHPFHFDTASPHVQLVEAQFRQQFGGQPSELVYRGYETVMWYAGMLKKYGTIFNEQYIDVSDAPFTSFRIAPQWDKNGYILYHENTHVYLTTYEAGMSKTTD